MNQFRTILLAHLISNVSLAFGQTNEPFSYLSQIEIQDFKRRFLHYSPELTEIINTKRSELPIDHKFYAEECEGEYMTLVANCIINKDSKQKYAIVYSACPGPEFLIFESNSADKQIGTINADHLYINGTGSLYGSGGEGTFDARTKFIIENGQLRHVNQPFYFVGLKSKTLNPIQLFEKQELENQIAYLPAEYEIEVLLSAKRYNETEALYLVKTSFGLVGWSKLKAGQYSAIDVEGLIYNGD